MFTFSQQKQPRLKRYSAFWETRETDSNQVRTVKITNRWPSSTTLYLRVKGLIKKQPTSGMSRTSPAAFLNVGASAGISAGPEYMWKIPFDNITSGTGKAGVCESALRMCEKCWQNVVEPTRCTYSRPIGACIFTCNILTVRVLVIIIKYCYKCSVRRRGVVDRVPAFQLGGPRFDSRRGHKF